MKKEEKFRLYPYAIDSQIVDIETPEGYSYFKK